MCFQLETIYFSISLNQAFFTFLAGLRHSMLHTYNSFISFLVKEFEYIFIIDFACGWFFSAGIITYLYIRNLIPTEFYILNKIAFVFLHMVSIIQNLAAGTIYSLAYFIGLS